VVQKISQIGERNEQQEMHKSSDRRDFVTKDKERDQWKTRKQPKQEYTTLTQPRVGLFDLILIHSQDRDIIRVTGLFDAQGGTRCHPTRAWLVSNNAGDGYRLRDRDTTRHTRLN
jgi:hypothetical protein